MSRLSHHIERAWSRARPRDETVTVLLDLGLCFASSIDTDPKRILDGAEVFSFRIS